MTGTREAATLDAAAFTRWCEDEVYTPAIRRGTTILERACDLHLSDLYRQLGFAARLATPRTARELSDGLGFEASGHIAVEALLTRLAERTGVVSAEPRPPAALQARAAAPGSNPALPGRRRMVAGSTDRVTGAVAGPAVQP